MNTKKTLMLEYSDWLFEDHSNIIYEKRFINEGISDTLMDLGQSTIAFIGALPPLEATGVAEVADAFNFAVYAARRQYVNAIFSLISVAPVVGDMIGKSGMIANLLLRMRRAGGLTTDVANFIARNASSLLGALRRLKTWVSNSTNRNALKVALRRAGQVYQEAGRNRQTETSGAVIAEASEDTNLGPVQPIYDFIINNASSLQRFFTNSSIVEALVRAVDEISTIFDDLIKMIEETIETRERSENVSSEPERTENLTEKRFKKLAGISD